MANHPPFLLHVAQAATGVTAPDPGIVALAVLVLATVSIYLWAPRMSVQRLTRAPAMRASLGLLVFFAVLPSVVPYDHLLPGLHQDETAAEEAVHAAHCHVSPGTCADAPLAAGPGQLLFTEPLVIAPAMLAILLTFAVPTLTGITTRPETRPPLG
ncbi:MAG: hypothetical protein KGK07_03030 [Chloroflexota bacterium]|nr:hypothetical protein [Chloroflexota bacterium]